VTAQDQLASHVVSVYKSIYRPAGV